MESYVGQSCHLLRGRLMRSKMEEAEIRCGEGGECLIPTDILMESSCSRRVDDGDADDDDEDRMIRCIG